MRVVNEAQVTNGVGRAWTRSNRTSVTYNEEPRNGLIFERWRHFPPLLVGEVELWVSAEISGTANCHGPGHGKAAGVGYTQMEYALDQKYQAVRAVADGSATHTTRREGLPIITLNIPTGTRGTGPVGSIRVPIVFHDGSGVATDSEYDYFADQACPVTDFWWKSRTQSKVFVWAQGSQRHLRGEANADIEGQTVIQFQLLEHNRCPN
ncbi:MAG: hypothetical protein KDB18_13740 [Salinibacterium sp.]|nr:hypothetical protein [Salinibacterium sp.]